LQAITANAYLEEVRERARVPVLDMIDETARGAVARVGSAGTIGVLATTGTLRARLYADAVARHADRARTISLLDLRDGREEGVELHERLVMEPIYGPTVDGERQGGGIKSGLLGDEDAERAARERAAGPLRRAIGLLGRAGADVCLLACTEIPLAVGRSPVDGVALLDPLQVTGAAAIAIAAGDRPLPAERGRGGRGAAGRRDDGLSER
jgi:aspartate racemase